MSYSFQQQPRTGMMRTLPTEGTSQSQQQQQQSSIQTQYQQQQQQQQQSHPIQSPTYQTPPPNPIQGGNIGGGGNPNQPQQEQGPNGGAPLAAGGNPMGGGGQAQGQGQQMNLASVLHYLQSEWRRWERDRNEWEIERAEMRARIALLEGERRSAENLKTDLLRRVKILEFALRQERSKTLNSASGHTLQASAASGLPPSKLAAIMNEDRGSERGSEKDGSGGSSSPRSEASNLPSSDKKPNGTLLHGRTASLHPSAAIGPGAANSVASQRGLGAGSGGDNPWKGSVVAPPRDMKSRAKSREYLKQCLQEISYLTSPAALNPLPTRLPLTLSIPSSLDGEASIVHPTLDVEPRPKKVLSDVATPGIPPLPNPQVSAPDASASEPVKSLEPVPQASQSQMVNGTAPMTTQDQSQAQTQAPAIGATGQNMEENERILTAIYKPESKEAWRDALKAANDLAEQSRRSYAPEASGAAPDASEHQLKVIAEETPNQAGSSFHWKPSRQLKSHLDLVNSVSFGPGGSIVSASSDCTVKVWRADLAALAGGRPSNVPVELEPQITFRGHTAPVTSLSVSTNQSLIFSGSLDSTIRVWRIPPPPPTYDTYSAYDPTLVGEVLVGHTDGVWSLAILPSPEDAEGYLVSASADGTCKVWGLAGHQGFPLLSSWGYDGLGAGVDNGVGQKDAPVPVSVSAYHADLQKVLVGYTNGVIKTFDLKNGQVGSVFDVPEPSASGDASPVTLTQAICHPTLPLVIAAMSDGTVRFYDSQSGKLSETLTAHQENVNCLDLDPTSSSTLITGGDDCSIKLWNVPDPSVTGTGTDGAEDKKPMCVQEWTLHRRKADQGVLAVKFHESVGLLASGGADGIVRLYVKGAPGS